MRGLRSPPPGVTPNFINPESQGHLVVIVAAITLTFAVLAVLMRIYTRALIVRRLGWDDCEYSIFAGERQI